MTAPPYPADTRAKGWRFELDHERIRQSDTWALATPELRPWLLMLWMVAWEQTPCGSLPADDFLIAARIGMKPRAFSAARSVLMRGWIEADDGRRYHPTLTERVAEMLARRAKDAERAANNRARRAESIGLTDGVTPESRVTTGGLRPEFDTGTGTGTGTTQQDKPVGKKARKRAAPHEQPESVPVEILLAAGFDGETAAEFISVKASRDAPLTARAWADHCREAAKAGWSPLQAAEKVMGKTWKGFEAKYVVGEAPGRTNGFHSKQQAIEDHNRAVGDAWLREMEERDAAH